MFINTNLIEYAIPFFISKYKYSMDSYLIKYLYNSLIKI